MWCGTRSRARLSTQSGSSYPVSECFQIIECHHDWVGTQCQDKTVAVLNYCFMALLSHQHVYRTYLVCGGYPASDLSRKLKQLHVYSGPDSPGGSST